MNINFVLVKIEYKPNLYLIIIFVVNMLKKRLFASIAYCLETKFIDTYLVNEIVVETQPPYCHVCKRYLTEFACNSIREVKCPYFEPDDSNKNKGI